MEHQAVLQRGQGERPGRCELGSTVHDAAHPQKMQRFAQRVGRPRRDFHDASMRHGRVTVQTIGRTSRNQRRVGIVLVPHAGDSGRQIRKESPMICVTGAGGTLSREVIRQLEQQVPFRAAYFSGRAAAAARARGIQAVVIDYNQPATLRTAFQGCDAVFLLGPNALNQTELELNAVDAASAAGVRRIVKQSVMGAAEEAYSLANIHRPVERAIERSGMAWTFLRPNSFMQNAVTFMAPTIRAEGVFYSASGEARISHVDVRDIAAVAVTALTAAGHEKKIYTLSGPEALTYDEVADELSKVL